MKEESRISFTPVFTKDGNEFVTPTKRFRGDTETEAKAVGWSASFVECIIWGASFEGKVIEVNRNTAHVIAEISGMKVAIISGPLFDQHYK